MRKSDFNQLRLQRFNEINSRLSSLTENHIRRHILAHGYYPEEQFLPCDYYVSSDLLRIPSNLFVSSKGKKIPKIPTRSASFVDFPKSTYTRRSLGIPDAENYIALVNFVTQHWKFFIKHLTLDPALDLIIPYSYPLFYFGHKRSEISIKNYKQFYEFDIRSWTHEYKHLLLVDIENFYASIYTHALSWALDEKTRLPKYYGNGKLFANQFDSYIRAINDNKSKGLLIGPAVSDLASEIILRKVDYFLSCSLANLKDKFVGGRFKDDYVFLSRNRDVSENILNKLQEILNNKFYLDLNESKTKIVPNFFEENSKLWKIETESLRDEIKANQEKEKNGTYVSYSEHQLSIWFNKTKQLYKQYGDKYIANSILGTLVDSIDGVGAVKITGRIAPSTPHKRYLSQLYISVFENIYDLCESVPSLWPHFFVFVILCLSNLNPDYKLIVNDIKKYLKQILKIFINKESNTFPMIWCLYLYWRLGFRLNLDITKEIRNKYKEHWLILSFIDRGAGSFIVGNSKFSLINRNRKKVKPVNKLLNVFTYDKLTPVH